MTPSKKKSERTVRAEKPGRLAEALEEAATPPFGLGQQVTTPEGVGRVRAFSQMPGNWRIRVELVDGEFWVGSAGAVSEVTS